MIEVLKEKVCVKFGRSIQTVTDCKELSEEIYKSTKELVSYNTIRRLFGIIDFRSPRISTLDILSKYVGESDFKQIVSLSFAQDIWTNQMRIYDQILSIEDSNYKKVFREIEALPSSEVVLVNILREFLHFRKIDLFLLFLDLINGSSKSMNYEHKLFIGNSVGILFKQLYLSDEDLRKCCCNLSFQEYVLLIYVDYSSLNGWYGRALTIVSESMDDSQISLSIFLFCLKEWKNYLNGIFLDSRSIQKMEYDARFHPILNSRICAIKLLDKPDQTEAILSVYSSFLSEIKLGYLYDAFYEIFLASVFVSEPALFDWLNKVKLNLVPTSIYHAQHHQLLQLSNLFEGLFYKKRNQIEKVLPSIKPNLFRNSYREFILSIYSVFSLSEKVTVSKIGYPMLTYWLSLKQNEYREIYENKKIVNR
jgi:hypothetical protein